MSEDKNSTFYPNTNFNSESGNEWYPNSDMPEIIELPREPLPFKGEEPSNRGVEILKIPEIPQHVIFKLRDAQKFGYLPVSLDHWIGTLGGAELIDKCTLDQLKKLRGEITGKVRDDAEPLERIIKVLSGLKPQKKGA